ncbi:MAG: deoxyribonuclease IV [Mycoplasma sp.]
MYKLKIGSHVSLSSPNYLVGSVNEALSYEANTFMIYTGPPQNNNRKDVKLFNLNEAHKLMSLNEIDLNDVIVHAPYIINLCSLKPETREFGKEVLLNELIRTSEMGFTKLVIHPGSSLKQDWEIAINQIVEGIDFALSFSNNDVLILLETMAGKGTEIGRNINDIVAIISKSKYPEKIGVCLDTCHLWDSGIDLKLFDEYLHQFEQLLDISKIQCIHINDSMNGKSSHKDRHQNLGYGNIGFENLINIIYHNKLEHVVKILETPYVELDGKSTPPYKQEIKMIRNKKFEKWF